MTVSHLCSYVVQHMHLVCMWIRELTNDVAPEPFEFRWTAEGVLPLQEVSAESCRFTTTQAACQQVNDPQLGCGLRHDDTGPARTTMSATEDFVVHQLEDCNLCAIHAKCVTISKHLAVHRL